MKALVFVALLALSSLSAACHPPVTIVTPAGKVAYTKDQIVVRINELESTAIQAAGTGGLPMAQAKVFVRFSVAADKAMKAPGWLAAVASLWADAKKELPKAVNPSILAAYSAVDVVLAATGGN